MQVNTERACCQVCALFKQPAASTTSHRLGVLTVLTQAWRTHNTHITHAGLAYSHFSQYSRRLGVLTVHTILTILTVLTKAWRTHSTRGTHSTYAGLGYWCHLPAPGKHITIVRPRLSHCAVGGLPSISNQAFGSFRAAACARAMRRAAKRTHKLGHVALHALAGAHAQCSPYPFHTLWTLEYRVLKHKISIFNIKSLHI
jgi:hypothetical protein